MSYNDMTQLRLELKGLDLGNPGPNTQDAYALARLRQQAWDWDAVVKSSHAVNCGFNMGCLFNVYVKNGVALREEQVGDYPPHNSETTDVGPRGCLMGVCYSHRMYDPTRIKYPLKRVGARGAGKWQRVSWDQALTEIADTFIDVLVAEGNEVVLSMRGTNASNSNNLSASSFEAALGLPNPDTNPDTGDEQPGVALTFGKIMFGESHDNWLYADMVILWGANPAYTHQPNCHYLTEARYNGARIVCISPEYNPSAHFADLWVPVNMGSDAALALGMAHVIVREGLYKPDFIREQTDLPLLVRSDNGKLLTQKDMQRGGRDNIFYVFDEHSRKAVEAPYRTLALNGIVPALEGEHQVETLAGRLKVKPVFQLLRQHLEHYTPEKASAITGVSPRLIEQLAREFAAARGVINVSTMAWGRHYHGDLIQRAQVLLWALCGHFGKVGSTYSSVAIVVPDTSFGYWFRRVADSLLSAESADPRVAAWREQGYTDEMIFYEYASESARTMAINPVLFNHFHANTAALTNRANSWDPHLKRPIKDYLDESLRQGWQWMLPRPEKEPRVIIERGGSFLRRSRSTSYLVNNLLPKLRLLVTVDARMGSTALYSDYVLPAACGYERFALFATVPTCPWLPIVNKAVQPQGEARSDWEVYCLLAKMVQERALKRGIATFTDRNGKERRLDNLYDQVTVQGLYTEHDEEAAARDFYLNTTNVQQMDWEELRERGYATLTGFGRVYPDSAADIEPGKPIVPLAYHVHHKRPYPTQTRRMQFYIDHDWFLELGETLPTHKDIPRLGGDFPLQVSGGHSRWSIHSLWKDNPVLLRLQRGEPIMYISPQDGAARGIADGDSVEVFNDVGRFDVQAAVSPAVRPGQVIIYHDWENFQFPGKRHFKSVTPSPLNPIELVGNYFHIRPRMVPLYACSPGATDRGVRVEVRKA